MPALKNKKKKKDLRIAKLTNECIPTGRKNIHRTRNKWTQKHTRRYSKKKKIELLNHEMLLLVSYLAENSYCASAMSTG